MTSEHKPHSVSRLELIRARLEMNPADPNGPAWQAAYMLDVKWLVEQYEVAKEKADELYGAELLRKVDAYDRARSRVKIEGNTRAEYVLRIESLEEQFDAMRETITRQHGLLWLVGLDTHEDEEQQSEEQSMENLRKLLREVSSPAKRLADG